MSPSILRAGRASLISGSLAMIGWGALAILVAKVFGMALETAVKDVFPSDQTIICETIAAQCELLPQLFVACGVGILGWATARTGRQRGWSVASGAAFALSLVLVYAVSRGGWNIQAFSNWRQPVSWNAVHVWGVGIATWLAICAGAQGIGRAAHTPEAPAWRPVVLVLCIIAGIGLCLTVLLRGWPLVIDIDSMNKLALQTKNFDSTRRIYDVSFALEFFLKVARWLAWFGLALTALIARAVMRTRTQSE